MGITMTPLNNNRGVALIVLIIAMTVIGVMATSLVSIVADKNKSMIYAYDGYHASVIADSGAEFAIRYISDGLSNSGSDYFQGLNADPTGSIEYRGYSPVYKIAGVTDPIGQFRVTRTLDTSDIDNDTILVESSYNGGIAVRKVKVRQFRRFLSPITFYPSYSARPYRDSSYNRRIYMPVIGNHNTNSLTISQIDLTVPVENMYLKYIKVWVPGDPMTVTTVFDFENPTVKSSYENCATATSLPCLDSTNGLKLKANVAAPFTVLKGMQSHNVYDDYRNDYYFDFESPPPAGSSNQYTVKLYMASWQPELKFVPNPTTP